MQTDWCILNYHKYRVSYRSRILLLLVPVRLIFGVRAATVLGAPRNGTYGCVCVCVCMYVCVCVSVCLSVCPYVRRLKWLDLHQVKSRMFHNGPSIAALHLEVERSKVKIKVKFKDTKMSKSFLVVGRCRDPPHVKMFPVPGATCLLSSALHFLLSASLYVSKRGAYWDRLRRDVVGWLSRACTVAKRCILGL